MKNILLLILYLFNFSNLYAQTSWKITDNYSIKFSGKGAEGYFKGLRGNILFDADNLATSSMEVTINPATISTGNSLKDEHARGESWFDVEQYAIAKFKSISFEKIDNGYKVIGNFTLHGTTNRERIVFSFTPTSNSKAIFKGKFTVDRTNYGIDGPLISFMVGDEFDVSLNVEVEK